MHFDEPAPYRNGSNGTNGAHPELPPTVSSYLQYLPAPYQGDRFMGRFLLIFESILAPIERTIDNGASYFDPRVTPVEFLPWLASWLGLELDENWPLERRRELVARGAELLRIQGTRRGLREHLAIYAGRTPLIIENTSGARLGQDSVMGINARIGEPLPHTLDITVLADRPLDERVVRGIIETHTPAHVAYTLTMYPAEDGATTSTNGHAGTLDLATEPVVSGASVVEGE
jgi:phage tail-like protein